MTIIKLTPRIANGFRMQFEPAQNAFVLLYPEGMIRLNQSAAEILRRCNGQKDVATIVAELEDAFDKQKLLPEILSFLDLAQNNGWVVQG